MACLAADGKLAPGEVRRQESIVGSVFDGHYEAGPDAAILPTIQGNAHVMSEGHLRLGADDPAIDRNGGYSHHQDDRLHTGADQGHHGQGEDDGQEGANGIKKQDHQAVHPGWPVSGDKSQYKAAAQGQGDRHQRHLQGDATAHHISTLLAGTGVKFSRIACGMPLGGDLEYADHVTIGRSLENRGPV